MAGHDIPLTLAGVEVVPMKRKKIIRPAKTHRGKPTPHTPAHTGEVRSPNICRPYASKLQSAKCFYFFWRRIFPAILLKQNIVALKGGF